MAVDKLPAKKALLEAIVHSVSQGDNRRAKDYALAFRLIDGGVQPGSAIVESK
ncbi:hypothetical protein [Demequina flava]|uniref:hypothetical protein n=1 Tax=Demequina flava TaxID=1095025 RepID=UPI000B1687A8|nr:hypothetical protein [Demequina flava]